MSARIQSDKSRYQNMVDAVHTVLREYDVWYHEPTDKEFALTMTAAVWGISVEKVEQIVDNYSLGPIASKTEVNVISTPQIS